MGIGIDTSIEQCRHIDSGVLRSVGIAGLGFYVPERTVTNHELSTMVDTTDEWIQQHIGIQTRHIADDDQALSDLAIEAGHKALKSAGLKARDIDMLVVTGQNHDYKAPATSCIVQHALGMRQIPAFDLAIGCSGFIYGLAVASKFVADGSAKRVLLIGAEIHSRMMSWKDRTTCVFFADGAGAVVLAPVERGYGLLGFDLGTDGSRNQAIVVPAGGSRMPITEHALQMREDGPHQLRALTHVRMDGKAVLAFATSVFPETIQACLTRLGLSPQDLDFVIAHQANRNIIHEGMTALGLPMDKTFMNLDRYGNCSSASIPIALTETVERRLIRHDDLVALVGFGVGLSWGSAIMRWA